MNPNIKLTPNLLISTQLERFSIFLYKAQEYNTDNKEADKRQDGKAGRPGYLANNTEYKRSANSREFSKNRVKSEKLSRFIYRNHCSIKRPAYSLRASKDKPYRYS